MLKKTAAIMLILLLPAFLLTSCQSIDRQSIKYTLNQLTDDEFEGRLYNTSGNEKTIEYITALLNQYEYTPMPGKEFIIPFEKELSVITSSSIVISNKQTILQLEEGKDYIAPLIPIALTGQIPDSIPDNSSGISDREITIKLDNTTLILAENDKRTGGSPDLVDEKNTTIIFTKSGMDKLLENKGSFIEINCEGSIDNITLNNVCGILKGNDSTRAVIIGAHFDHMGKSGDTIYRGAVDNASGTAVLLDVCKQLAGKTPAVDIVFTFWNAEEFGMQGSKALAPLFEKIYGEYCYINIDCVGMKEGGNALITTANASDTMCTALNKLLSNNGYPYTTASDDYMPSDHTSFTNCGSVNIGQSMDTINSIIHHPADTIDMISIEELEQLSLSFAKSIEFSSEQLLSSAKESSILSNEPGLDIIPEADYFAMSFEEQADYLSGIEKQLAFDEYFILPYRSHPLCITSKKGEYFSSLDKANELFDKLDIITKIGDYELVQIHVLSDTVPANGTIEEKGKIIKRLVSNDLIYTVELYYKNNDSMVIYREDFKQGNDLMNNVEMYEDYEQYPGMDNVWIIYTEADHIPAALYAQSGENLISLSQGPVYADEEGIYSNFYPDDIKYTTDTLISFYQNTISTPPINMK